MRKEHEAEGAVPFVDAEIKKNIKALAVRMAESSMLIGVSGKGRSST